MPRPCTGSNTGASSTTARGTSRPGSRSWSEAVLNVLVRELEVEREVETIIAVSNVEDALHLPTGRRGELAIQTLVRNSFDPKPRRARRALTR